MFSGFCVILIENSRDFEKSDVEIIIYKVMWIVGIVDILKYKFRKRCRKLVEENRSSSQIVGPGAALPRGAAARPGGGPAPRDRRVLGDGEPRAADASVERFDIEPFSDFSAK